MAIVIKRAIGFPKKFTTFTIILPLILISFGFFVPFTLKLNELITGINFSHEKEYIVSLTLFYLCLYLGIVLSNTINAKVAPGEIRYHPTRTTALGSKIYLLLISILSIFYLLLIYATSLNFDFVSYLSGIWSYSDYELHRYSFARATTGLEYYLYNKLPYSLMPMIFIAIWLPNELSKFTRISVTALLLFCIAQTCHKMPIIYPIIFIICSLLANKSNFTLAGKQKIVLFLTLLLIIFGVIPIFYIAQGSSYIDSLIWSVLRVFGETVRTLQLHFEVYPNVHPFLNGASTKTIHAIIGSGDFLPPSIYIPYEFLNLRNTSFPTLFIGEAWADFGYVGVSLYSLFVGWLLQTFNHWFYRQKELTNEKKALYLATMFSSLHLLQSNLLTTFISYGLITNILIYHVLKLRLYHTTKTNIFNGLNKI